MKTYKKAFTLHELIVTLAVVVVVLAMITGVVLATTNITQQQTYNQNCQAEYQDASKFINQFANTYSTFQFSIFDVQSNDEIGRVVIEKDSEKFVLAYQKEQNKIVAEIFDMQSNQVKQKEMTLSYITKIIFTRMDNLIKCDYYFDNFPTYTDLIIFGVN